jgi:hypothetical protein
LEGTPPAKIDVVVRQLTLRSGHQSKVTWFGAGLDLGLGRAWYLMVSGTRESGPDATDQLYTALSYRF